MSPITSPKKTSPMKTASSSNIEDEVTKPKRSRFTCDATNIEDLETDPATLARRQKQIEYGKNTEEYINYRAAIPKQERQPFHPKTPNMHRKYSRRAWDGLVKVWRQNLHVWSQKSDGSVQVAEQEIKLGASATLSDCGDSDRLNESFHSESTADTASTSSSISAAFTGILFGNKSEVEVVEVKKEEPQNDLDTTITQEVNGQGDLNTSADSGTSEGGRLSASWAEEVEEEYYNGENDNTFP